MIDFNELKKIKKKRETYQKELDILYKNKQKIEAKLKELKPATVIPVSFESNELTYNFAPDNLILGRLDVRNLSKNTKFQMGCPVDYTGKINDGIAQCNLTPQNQKIQEKLIEIEKEIVKYETMLTELSKLEEYILDQQRSCDYIYKQNEDFEEYD